MDVELPMCLLPWIDINKLNWFCLSANPNAIQLLKANPEKIDWHYLSCNPNAMQLLKNNPDKIYWEYLSYNTSFEAIELLKANPLKIHWYNLSQNPHIFTYDYEKMRENCLLFKEDLMKERFHPRNLYKFGSWGHNGGLEAEED